MDIAVEGFAWDIVPVVCEGLKYGGYNICYRHESSRNVDVKNIDDLLTARPDLAIVCNALGYIPYIREFTRKSTAPLLVLTGGGPDWEDQAMHYTPHVLPVPFRFQELYKKIDEIISSGR